MDRPSDNKCNDCCTYTESDIVDALLETHAEVRPEELERHADGCASCAALLRQWRGLLADGGQTSAPAPSPAARRRLIRSLSRRGAVRRAITGFRSRLQGLQLRVWPMWGVTTAMVAAIYAAALWHAADRLREPSSPMALAQADDEIMKHMAMTGLATTTRYPVVINSPGSAHGVVWVNGEEEELLLLVEGLPETPGEDYRVWSSNAGRRTELGTLHQTAGKAHLHYQGSGMHAVDTITVSRERRGASAADASEVAAINVK